MEDAGILPNNVPPRRWSIGDDAPVADSVDALPAALTARLRECAAGPPDELPPDYGDPNGLWLTVRGRNPFDILLLYGRSQPSAEAILVRFRVLWKFWTHKATIARQGATRAVIRQKYGDHVESYIDNLQWAYDQLSTAEGIAFWRDRLQQQRAQALWARVVGMIDATLADGVLEVAETQHLIARAEEAGYEREEFAEALRRVLHARNFESEAAPIGATEAERLASARWATAEAWSRLRSIAAPTVPPQFYYVRVGRTALGPMTAAQVEELIRTRRVSAVDGVCVVGAPVWQVIGQSHFAHHFGTAVPVCPRCGHGLTVATRSAAAGIAVLIFGIVTAVIYIGLFLTIVGIAMIVAANKARWHCSHCGYWS